MDFYGVNHVGYVKVESLYSLPVFNSERDKRRLVYIDGEDKFYYGGDAEWKDLDSIAGVSLTTNTGNKGVDISVTTNDGETLSSSCSNINADTVDGHHGIGNISIESSEWGNLTITIYDSAGTVLATDTVNNISAYESYRARYV